MRMLPNQHSSRTTKTLFVGGTSVVAILGWIACRLDAGEALPTFAGACRRIALSDIPPSPGDWWCTAPAWHRVADVILFSLLTAIAVAVPSAILATLGHRGWALVPLLAFPFAGDWSVVYWTGEDALLSDPIYELAWALMINAVLIAAPSLAIMRVTPPTTTAYDIDRSTRVKAGAFCAVATVVLLLITSRTPLRGRLDLLDLVNLWWLPAAAVMAWLGTLQARQHRWWPTSLAVCAFLLSLGPAFVVITTFKWNPEGEWLILSTFGATIPLFLVGLIWTHWESIAVRLGAGEAPTRPVGASWVAWGLSATLLVGALGLYAADPFPERVSVELPTFLVTRESAVDARTWMDLAVASKVVQEYRRRHGSLKGFSPSEAEQLDRRFMWSDDLQDARPAEYDEPHTIIVSSQGESVKLLELNHSGDGQCIQVGRDLRYGSAEEGKSTHRDYPATAALGLRACGSGPWDPSLAVRPELPECTPGSGPFLICRMVQVLIWNILKDPPPPSQSARD